MKLKRLLLFLLAASGAALPPGRAQETNLPAFQIQWQRTLGGDADDQLRCVVPTSDGGMLLAGESLSDVSGTKTAPSYGGRDWWVVRLDADGNELWQQGYGGSGDEALDTALATSDGGFLLAGISTSPPDGNKTAQLYGGKDVWLVRIDSQGTMLWDKSYGTAAFEVGPVLCLPMADGGFVLGCSSNGGRNGTKTSPFHGTYPYLDYWVVRIDANGNQLWDADFGGTADDELTQLVQAPDGGFLLGGASKSQAGGNKTTPHYADGEYDAWVVKIDGTGQKQWEADYGGTPFTFSATQLTALLPLPSLGYLLCNRTIAGKTGDKTVPGFGGDDNWLILLGLDGTETWQDDFGGNQYEAPTAAKPMPNGGAFVGGWSISTAGSGTRTSPLVGGVDAWIYRVGPDGRKIWDRGYGTGDGGGVSSGGDALLGMELAADGGLVIAGGGDIQNAISTPPPGTLGVWAMQIDANGNPTRPLTRLSDLSGYFTTFGRLADGNFYAGGYTATSPADYRIIKFGPPAMTSRPGPPQLLPLADLQGQIPTIGFLTSTVGPQGATCVTEFSTDLVAWTPLVTNHIGVTELRFTDASATNATMRFYRSRLSP